MIKDINNVTVQIVKNVLTNRQLNANAESTIFSEQANILMNNTIKNPRMTTI